MESSLQLNAVVALVQDQPSEGMVSGQVGTIVEILDAHSFIVEFCDEEGLCYALTTLQDTQLMPQRNSPATA